MTADQVLAAVEAIPETPENFRQVRDAVRAAKTLAAQQKEGN